LACAEPQRQHQRGQHRHAQQLLRRDPQDLPDQQVLQMLAAVRVAGEQQQASARRQHEQHADQRLLDLRPAALGPGQHQGSEQRRRQRRHLNRPALRLEPHRVRRNDANSGDLRDRQVDENDPAIEHLGAQRHVRGQHQQPGQ